MTLAVILLALAIASGAAGLLVSGLKWLLIIAAVLFVLGALTGARGGTMARRHSGT